MNGARGFWARVLAGALVAAPLAVVATAPSTSATTSGVTAFSYVSQPGDYVGQGRSGTITDPDAFRISGTAGLVTVSIDTGSEWWGIDLAAPRGQQLTTGAYENVTRAGFNTTYAGLDVSSTGRGCNATKGRFTVYAISADTAGRITALDATFTQFCDASTGGLTGTVRYAAPAPAALVLTSSDPATVADQPVTLTARVSPGTSNGVSFVDGGTVIGQATPDAAGLARFTTSRLAAGAHTLTAKQNTTTSAPVTQVVAGALPSLWFASQYGDYIGQGATSSFTPPGATVRLTGTAQSATFSVDDPSSGQWWSVDVAAPPGEDLHPGSYTGATRASFRGAGEPGLDASGSGRGCNTLTGSFTVNGITTNPDGTVAGLDVSFVQNCEGATPSLTGRARVDNAPIDLRAATTTVLTGGTTSDGAIGLVATVTGGSTTPTGVVTFREGAAVLGTGAVDGSGKAYLIAAGLPFGSHTISADYGGDAGYLPSSGSATFVLAVLPTTTSISASKTAKVGKPVPVETTVSWATGSPGASGQARLYDGATAVGTAVTLAAGSATITWTPTTKGTHSLTVRYLGDATNAPSTSTPSVVKVT